jgi:hypothetical protein
MACPVVNAPKEGDDMRKIHERTATPEELAEDRRRCLAANAKPATPPPPQEGNLCACLVTFAAWRHCCTCGSLVLFVNAQAGTDGDFECGLCEQIRENLSTRLRRMSLPIRAALHLRALFTTANDNRRQVSHAS